MSALLLRSRYEQMPRYGVPGNPSMKPAATTGRIEDQHWKQEFMPPVITLKARVNADYRASLFFNTTENMR